MSIPLSSICLCFEIIVVSVYVCMQVCVHVYMCV